MNHNIVAVLALAGLASCANPAHSSKATGATGVPGSASWTWVAPAPTLKPFHPEDPPIQSGADEWNSPRPAPPPPAAERDDVEDGIDADVVLADEVRQFLLDDSLLAARLDDVEITVHDGQVTLRGVVKDDQSKNEIVNEVNRLPEVRSVENHLLTLRELTQGD